MKNAVTAFCVFLSVLLLGACQKDSGSPSVPSMLAGTWMDPEQEQVVIYVPWPDTHLITVIIRFDADGRYVLQNELPTKIGVDGDWDLSGDERNILFTPLTGAPGIPQAVRWQIDKLTRDTLQVVEHVQGQAPGFDPYHFIKLRTLVRI